MEGMYNTLMDRMRNYSSVFSRAVFSNIIKFQDVTPIDAVGKTYDSDLLQKDTMSYLDYLAKMYDALKVHYRCEYVYKNIVVNQLLRTYAGPNTVILNEFHVGDSVADIVLFNGNSRAYEIKTDLDTPRRLSSQLDTYTHFFQETYIVIPESLYDEYLAIVDGNIGIIVLEGCGKRLKLAKYREATENSSIDFDILKRTLRIPEYEGIVRSYYSSLPDVGYYEMYDACWDQISKIPNSELIQSINTVIKKRKNNTLFLNHYEQYLRQMCLAMNVNEKQYSQLYSTLCKQVVF